MRAILTTLLASISFSALAADPQFVRIQPDQASYEVGAKAIVFAYVDRLPTESTKEFFVSMRVGGELTNTIRLSDRLLVALPKRFQDLGIQFVESNVFLQTKAEQLQLAQSVAFYQRQIDALSKQLEDERDPEKQALLEAVIAKQQMKLLEVQGQIEGRRTLVEVGQSSILVTPSSSLKPASTFTLTANRDPAEYFVGESAIFTAHLNTQFTGPDGPKEAVLRGKIGETSVVAPGQSGDDFVFTSPVFTASHLGDQNLTVDYSVRSKAQADLLRNASILAGKQKQDLEKKLADSVVPEERAYLEAKVLEMTQVMNAIALQLEEILVEVDENSLNFTVMSGGRK